MIEILKPDLAKQRAKQRAIKLAKHRATKLVNSVLRAIRQERNPNTIEECVVVIHDVMQEVHGRILTGMIDMDSILDCANGYEVYATATEKLIALPGLRVNVTLYYNIIWSELEMMATVYDGDGSTCAQSSFTLIRKAVEESGNEWQSCG